MALWRFIHFALLLFIIIIIIVMSFLQANAQNYQLESANKHVNALHEAGSVYYWHQ